MCLQLCMCGCRVAAALANIWPFPSMGALMIVFCLICCKRLVAAFIAASVWPVACMAEQVPGELRALFEVLRCRFATLPLAEAVCAIVDMGSFDMFV